MYPMSDVDDLFILKTFRFIHYIFYNARRLLIAADAPADAKSCFELTLRVTRGKLLPLEMVTVPVLVRFGPGGPVNVVALDCLRGGRALLGLVPAAGGRTDEPLL